MHEESRTILRHERMRRLPYENKMTPLDETVMVIHGGATKCELVRTFNCFLRALGYTVQEAKDDESLDVDPGDEIVEVAGPDDDDPADDGQGDDDGPWENLTEKLRNEREPISLAGGIPND